MSDKKNAEQASKPKKIKKAPGFFKKILTEGLLEKNYLRHIEQPDDKAFLRSCYTEDGESLLIRQDLDGKEVKRLKLLKKAINQNRKFAVNLLPLGFVAALIAGLVIFFTIFANPLLQKALETGLEAVFEAKVNADNFRISLFKFEIAMNSLTIADRDRPMKNLIQFSTMRIKLKPQAVLRGKVFIEEIRTDHIRFGTDRTVSGALPGMGPKEQKPKEEITIPPLVDLKNFDAMALLNQEYGKLQTPKLYDTAIGAYDTAVAKWKGEQEAAMARIAELQTRAQPLLKINVNDYKVQDLKTLQQTVEQIRATINDVNAMVSTVQAAQGDVNRMVSGVQDDINTARALEQSARNAFTEDFNHLRSYLDLGSGALMDVIEPIIKDILTESAETYLSYGERALEVLEKVKEMQAKLPKSDPKPKVEKFKGRDVVFPTRQYPRFFLGILATDVLTPKNWHWGFDLRGVSSDPDLSGAPTTLVLSLAESGDGLKRTGAFNGRADFRSNASERFNADLSGGGFPVDISAGLSRIGVGGLSGGASFKVNASGRTNGGFTGGGGVSLVQAKLSNPSNTFAQAADEAIQQVKSVDLGIQYEHVVSGRDRFSVTTNFGDIFKDALARIVSQYRKQAEDALEKALREKIEQYIDGKFVSKEDLDAVFRLMRGDKSAVDDLRNTLDRKKTELENKLKEAGQQAVDELKQQAQQAVDEAKQQAQQVVDETKQQAQQAGQQAVQDLLQGQTPSAPSVTPPSITPPAITPPTVPSIPGLRR